MALDTTLITGANGFIGAAIARRLFDQGVPVIGVDQIPGLAPYHTFQADLSDVHRTYSILKQFEIRHIIHCGGVSGSMLFEDNPYAICHINITGTLHLLEAARLFGIQRFVYCSSISAYGAYGSYGRSQTDPLTEAAGFAPTDVYGASKAAGDVLVQAYSHQGYIDGVALRIGSVFGPGRRTYCPIQTILMSSLTQQWQNLSGSSRQRRQYIYVDDVVDGAIAALQIPALAQRVYNIASPIWLSLQEMVEIIQQEIPDIKVNFELSSDRADPDDEALLAIAFAAQDLKFHPNYSFQSGVKAYYHWLRD